MSEVVRVLEVVGPRGGKVFVHLLDCGHWFWRRGGIPQKKCVCVACHIAPQIAALKAAGEMPQTSETSTIFSEPQSRQR